VWLLRWRVSKRNPLSRKKKKKTSHQGKKGVRFRNPPSLFKNAKRQHAITRKTLLCRGPQTCAQKQKAQKKKKAAPAKPWPFIGKREGSACEKGKRRKQREDAMLIQVRGEPVRVLPEETAIFDQEKPLRLL